MESKISPDYFTNIRSEIGALLPSQAERVLEIGSGRGGTIGWLRERWPAAEFTAVDGFEPMREPLEAVAHHVHIVDLNRGLPALQRYDLILALDILEHLIDPWGMLATLVDHHLQPDGCVIVSIPNVSRLTVALPLLLGRFRYEDHGVLDSTHLRFFTRESALELMARGGLAVDAAGCNGIGRARATLLDRVTLGAIRDRIAVQFVMRGRRGGDQVRPRWSVLS